MTLPLAVPLDTWVAVFRNLGCRDWIHLRQVCHAFNDIGAELLFSSIRIFLFDRQSSFGLLPDEEFPVFPNDEDQGVVLQAERLTVRSWEILDYITRNPKFAVLIRTLTVYAFYTTGGIFERLCLVNAIRKLPRLTTFRWLSGGVNLPDVVTESLPVHLTSLFFTHGPRELLVSLDHLRQLREIIIHAFRRHIHDESISSLQVILAENTDSLRKLSLPSNQWASMPIRLLENLTHLHMDRTPSAEDAELDLNFALRHTTRLESLSLPPGNTRHEREIIAALHDNDNALTNLVSLQLRFHWELPILDEDRLFHFLRGRRKLQQLYLQYGQSNDPSYFQKIILSFKELPNLRVLGLDPYHADQYSVLDVLPPGLMAFHAALPTEMLQNLTFLRELEEFNNLTYLDLNFADSYQVMPSDAKVDNPNLQLLVLNGDMYDVRSGIPIIKRPVWKHFMAFPEDFEDEDHWWLWHGITQYSTQTGTE